MSRGGYYPIDRRPGNFQRQPEPIDRWHRPQSLHNLSPRTNGRPFGFESKPADFSGPEYSNIRNKLRSPVERGFAKLNLPEKQLNSGPARNAKTAGIQYSSIESINRVEKARRKRSMDEEVQGKKMKLEANQNKLFICIINIPAVVEFKREMELRDYKNLLVKERCQYNARYQYLLKTKGLKYAEANALKTVSGSYAYVCDVCDMYFGCQKMLDSHCETQTHFEINCIFKALKCLADDWSRVKLDPSTKLTLSTILAEKVGVVVQSKEKTVTDNFIGLDPFKMEPQEFILSVFENEMKDVWPQPSSPFFCRSCNYSEFQNHEALDRHLKSARHLEYERHYNEAFCIPCQKHNGDQAGMEKHAVTDDHLQNVMLMEFMRKYATEYLHLVHNSHVLPKDEKAAEMKNLETADTSEEKQSDVSKGNSILSKINAELKAGKSSTSSAVSSKISTSPKKNDVEYMNKTENNKSAELLITAKPNTAVKTKTNQSIVSDVSVQTGEGLAFVKQCSNCRDVLNSTKSQITQLLELKHEKQILEIQLDNCRAQLEDYEKMKKLKEEESKGNAKSKDTLDGFMVPLSGFMCTVCHETTNSHEEALTHQRTSMHQQNVKSHKDKFGFS